MKKEKTLVLPVSSTAKLRATFFGLISQYAQLISGMVEEEVSPANALRVTHAVIAFIALLICGSIGSLPALIALCWFATTLVSCKKGGLK